MDVFERVMMCLILAATIVLASLAAAIVKLSRALLHDFDGRLRRLEGRDSGGCRDARPECWCEGGEPTNQEG